MSIQRAIQRAKSLATSEYCEPEVVRSEYPRQFAIGDPQAPLETFLQILHHNELLASEGMLKRDVSLIVAGDYFDWGTSAQRKQAGQSGLEILAWLAAHPRNQVGLILGNHDLGRVGELADFDDQTFAKVHRQALLAYRDGDVDQNLENELCSQFPQLPTAELAARDFASFCQAQRTLVSNLLRADRFKIAMAIGKHILITHAGITCEILSNLGIKANADAKVIAYVLNDCLQTAVFSWQEGAFKIANLHIPGSRAHGEGVGIFYHRPIHPQVRTDEDEQVIGTLKRRYDPRDLPLGLTQIIGHISDSKCRQLLGAWVADEEPVQGAIRVLESDGKHVSYTTGMPRTLANSSQATMIFIDGQMNKTDPADYEILDLNELKLHG